jgi:hypothetical protein
MGENEREKYYIQIWRVKKLIGLYKKVYFISPPLSSSKYICGENKFTWTNK